MRFIDLHCDTISEIMEKDSHLSNRKGHINTSLLKEGGSLAQCFALFIDSKAEAYAGKPESDPYFLYSRLLKTYRQELDLNRDSLRPALCAEDIEENRQNGFISSILTIEDADLIGNDLSRLDALYRDDVRMIALTWNYENCLGYPNSSDSILHMKPLKDFGREAVIRMNELGIIVDVSHLSEGGFWDVAELSSRPFVASHSCCRALCGHQRNLTDAQMKKIADCGGVIGINFFTPFINEKAEETTIEDVVYHMRHMKNICGTDAMAWGSDFDGIDDCVLEFKNYAGLRQIENELKKYFTDDDIEKINHKNFIRVFRAQEN